MKILLIFTMLFTTVCFSQQANKKSSSANLSLIDRALAGDEQALKQAQAEIDRKRMESTNPANPFDPNKGPSDKAVLDKRYSKVDKKLNLNPMYMSNQDMENTYQEYKKQQYLKWSYIILGICALIGAGIFITKIKK